MQVDTVTMAYSKKHTGLVGKEGEGNGCLRVDHEAFDPTQAETALSDLKIPI